MHVHKHTHVQTSRDVEDHIHALNTIVLKLTSGWVSADTTKPLRVRFYLSFHYCSLYTVKWIEKKWKHHFQQTVIDLHRVFPGTNGALLLWFTSMLCQRACLFVFEANCLYQEKHEKLTGMIKKLSLEACNCKCILENEFGVRPWKLIPLILPPGRVWQRQVPLRVWEVHWVSSLAVRDIQRKPSLKSNPRKKEINFVKELQNRKYCLYQTLILRIFVATQSVRSLITEHFYVCAVRVMFYGKHNLY